MRYEYDDRSFLVTKKSHRKRNLIPNLQIFFFYHRGAHNRVPNVFAAVVVVFDVIVVNASIIIVTNIVFTTMVAINSSSCADTDAT